MEDRFLIVRDTREKEDHGYMWSEDNFCRGTIVEKLDYGDYSVKNLEHLIFIDRKKSTSELSQNLCEERFKALLNKVQRFKYKYILCEFDYEDILNFPLNSGIPRWQQKKLKVTPAFMNSYLARLTIQGFNVVYAGNSQNAEEFCYSLLKNIYKVEQNV